MSRLDFLFYQFLAASFATLFGACVGSFLNVCIYRIPRDESVIAPRSHCPHCNTLIPWYLNIPVLSWLCLRGRCATCKGPIAFRYTLVELLTGMLFLAVFMKWAAPATMRMPPITDPLVIPIYWIFLSGLVLGTFVDFEHFIIPDSVTIGGMVVGPLECAGSGPVRPDCLVAGVTLFSHGSGRRLRPAVCGRLDRHARLQERGHGVRRREADGRDRRFSGLEGGASSQSSRHRC